MTTDYGKFGRGILETQFPHMAACGVVMLNSGSFGVAPKCVLERKVQLVHEFESYGDNFVRLRQIKYFTESIRSVADLLNLRPEQCTLVDNVTTGICNLLDYLVKPGDAILVNSWTYGAVKFAAELVGDWGHKADSQQHQQLEQKHKVFNINIRLPLESAEDFVERVGATLLEHPEIRIAIFDHITSATACVMPVKRLTELCHSHNVIVIIDGAHAIGQIPNLDIESIGADFYIGNLHKWLFAPKSAALMWASEAFVDGLRPSVVSWLVHDPDMSLRYAFLGTRDSSSILAVSEAVRFVRDVCGGLDRIHAYCSQLADEASQHLVKSWNSELLQIPASMQAPFMRLVSLPEHLQHLKIREMTRESRLMSPMWDFVLNKLKADVLLLDIQDRLYIRVSFAIIVCMDDIRKLGDTMMKLRKEDFTG